MRIDTLEGFNDGNIQLSEECEHSLDMYNVVKFDRVGIARFGQKDSRGREIVYAIRNRYNSAKYYDAGMDEIDGPVNPRFGEALGFFIPNLSEEFIFAMNSLHGHDNTLIDFKDSEEFLGFVDMVRVNFDKHPYAIPNVERYEKLLHTFRHKMDEGNARIYFNEEWTKNLVKDIRKHVQQQASEIWELFFGTVEIGASGFKGFTPSKDSMVETVNVLDAKTVRLIFKQPVRPNKLQQNTEIYTLGPDIVNGTCDIHAIDMKFSETGDFPTVTAWANKECSRGSGHPNVASGGTVCLGTLRRNDLHDREITLNSGVTIPTLRDFINMMMMINYDSSYHGRDSVYEIFKGEVRGSSITDVMTNHPELPIRKMKGLL